MIGYAGTATHSADLRIVEEALGRISRKWGEKVAFRFLGCATERIQALPGLSFVRFEPSYSAYAAALPSAGIDIGVVPLADTPFNRCKSDIKWLEYSASAIAGVYSDLPPYQRIRQGITGSRVPNTSPEWFAAIDRLVEDAEMRRRIASHARQEVVLRHGMRAGAEHLWQIYRGVAGATSRRAARASP